MIIVVGLLLAFLVGILVLSALGIRLNRWEVAGLAPGIGSGLITLTVFVLLNLNLTVSVVSALLAIAGLLGVLGALTVLRIRRTGWPQGERMGTPRLDTMPDFVLLALIVLLVGFTFVIALYWPPHAWDALSIWVVKGKAINDLGDLAGAESGAYGFYPLHVPLLIALLLLGLPITVFKIIFPIYFVLLLLSYAGSLLRLTHGNHSLTLVFVLMLAATPTLLMQSTVAMADVIFTYFYVSSALCLLIFVSGGQVGFALLSGLLAGMASWTRPEGLLYFSINTVVLAIYLVRHRARTTIAFPYVLTFALFWWPWARYSGQNTYLTGAALSTVGDVVRFQIQWDKLIAVLDYFRREWTAIEKWGVAWILFGVSTLNLRQGRRNPYLLTLILLNVAGLVFTYYAVPTNTEGLTIEWWLDTGFVRMATHFMPLLLFYAFGPYVDLTAFRYSKIFSRIFKPMKRVPG